MEPLIQLLNAVHPISTASEAQLRKTIKRFTFKKGAHIVTAGEVASLILYLEKGLIRSYTPDGEKKKSNYFMREGDLIVSVESFFQQIPAPDSIEPLEPCVGWGITWEELEKMYSDHIEFNVNGRRLCQAYYCKSEERHRNRHGINPEVQYAWLMNSDPELVRRVKDTHLAGYLDVSKTTLYRIKRDFASNSMKAKRS